MFNPQDILIGSSVKAAILYFVTAFNDIICRSFVSNGVFKILELNGFDCGDGYPSDMISILFNSKLARLYICIYI